MERSEVIICELTVALLNRADCSDYRHVTHIPGRHCSCGIDELLDRIFEKGAAAYRRQQQSRGARR